MRPEPDGIEVRSRRISVAVLLYPPVTSQTRGTFGRVSFVRFGEKGEVAVLATDPAQNAFPVPRPISSVLGSLLGVKTLGPICSTEARNRRGEYPSLNLLPYPGCVSRARCVPIWPGVRKIFPSDPLLSPKVRGWLIHTPIASGKCAMGGMLQR